MMYRMYNVLRTTLPVKNNAVRANLTLGFWRRYGRYRVSDPHILHDALSYIGVCSPPRRAENAVAM